MVQEKTPKEIANDFYDCIINKNGEGLSDMVTPDVAFKEPFFTARGTDKFLEGMQRWARLKKRYNMVRQFVDGNDICSIYIIHAQAPLGVTVSWDAVDWIEIKEGRINNIHVYFDPRDWAKAIGS